MNDVTQYLSAIEAGDPQPPKNCCPSFTTNCAAWRPSGSPRKSPAKTLQATALVHEAYLRLLGPEVQDIDRANRAHFFAAAAEAMKRILIENARRKRSVKHGGGLQRLDLVDAELVSTPPPTTSSTSTKPSNGSPASPPRPPGCCTCGSFSACPSRKLPKFSAPTPEPRPRLSYAKAWLFRNSTNPDRPDFFRISCRTPQPNFA